MTADIKRTPDQWCQLFGLVVRDPDGWRMDGAPDWSEPIDLSNFAERAFLSTTGAVGDGDPFQRIHSELADGGAA